MNGIEQGIKATLANKQMKETKVLFQNLIQTDQYVGEMYSINYESAKIQIHDSDRQKVGGIPSLSFLIATRVEPSSDKLDFKAEDASIILLRVMDATQLPNSSEAERIRVETAQRVSGDTEKHWDSKEAMDLRTKMYLSYAAVECRIIGTFYLGLKDETDNNSSLVLKFGSDISNFYPNRGLKVFKPTAKALDTIVNYFDKAKDFVPPRVEVGHIRYASTNRKFQLEAEKGKEIEKRYEKGVPVNISPADLLSQKSAVFGMTRTGKSNTVKVIAKSVYELRYSDIKLEKIENNRIGQIILDPNGEYANENEQDKDGKGNPNALKNIWRQDDKLKAKADDLKKKYKSTTDRGEKTKIWNEIKKIVENEVVTYGILPHPKDPFRRLMKINFYEEENLQIGKEIIDFKIADQSAQYFKNFRQIVFSKPIESEFETEREYQGQLRRYERRVLVYKALLNKAEFTPSNRNVSIKGYFNADLRNIMIKYGEKEKKFTRKQGLINAAGRTLSQDIVSWDSLAPAFEGLFHFLSTSNYNSFNQNYIDSRDTDDENDGSGEGWAEADLETLLEMFNYSKGTNLIGAVNIQHTTTTSADYAQEIYNDLVAGKLVIVDQSSGEPEVNQSAADRIMWKIFKNNQDLFRSGKPITPILMYIEEAHNILPSGSDLDLKNVWVRTAKEGAKYNIGMVYSTQEVSSIQKNVLKNTANWFIGHLNNTDETKELCKYYDFADFESSIRRTQDKGFLRIKTLSNYFVIPVQVKLFDVTEKN